MKTRDIVLIGVFAAMICVFAPFSVPVGPIPVSLASFAVYIAAVLGAKKACAAVGIYILIGALGLPVFSGFSGGISKIAGLTGGYIIGYMFCALLSGIIIERAGNKKSAYPMAFIIGTAALYAFGTAWFMIQSGNGLYESLLACVIPFLIGDAVKIAAASVVVYRLRNYNFVQAL